MILERTNFSGILFFSVRISNVFSHPVPKTTPTTTSNRFSLAKNHDSSSLSSRRDVFFCGRSGQQTSQQQQPFRPGNGDSSTVFLPGKLPTCCGPNILTKASDFSSAPKTPPPVCLGSKQNNPVTSSKHDPRNASKALAKTAQNRQFPHQN